VPAHAAPRRTALPALLLTVAAAALGGLALLPSPAAAPARAVLASAPAPPAAALQGETERAAVLGRPPVKATVVRKAVKRPAPRPAVVRAARKRVSVSVPVTTGYVCPVRGRTSFSDDWGDPRSGGRRHQGTDIIAAYGAPVVAVTSGVVHTAYSSAGGISLYLRGTDGDEYFYAHNSRNVASDGERVQAGEVIAYVGTSGNARGGPPHVHFERHPDGGRPVDPYPFLRRVCGG
jgi:murein DD-endopeptidase MepM/ murein hydrolase activator NlpD